MRRLILIVDDNQLTRMLVGDALRQAGYETIHCASASDALESLQRETPIACFVDHVMKGATGSQLIQALRASPERRLRSMPIVGMSSSFEKELLRAGANVVLKKPLTERTIIQAVDQALASAAVQG